MSQSPFRLDGKTAFVSGSRGHLGAAMTRALCEAGAHVIVNGRDDSALADFETGLRRDGHAVSRAAFDAFDSAAVRRFFGGLERLDILVNNAVAMQMKSFADVSPEDFAATYASAVTAGFEAVRAARPALAAAARASGDASVITIASMYGQVSPDAGLYPGAARQGPFHYGPAKAAQCHLRRHLAAELGPQGIRVSALVPGPFPARVEAAFGARLAARTMLGRLGRPEDIAGPLLFLAAPAAAFVTGAALNVDGGWTAW